MVESLPINIIILPDEKTAKKARELGKILGEKYETNYSLADEKFIPHATIYQAQYPIKNLEAVRKNLRELIGTLSPYEVEMSTYLNHHGYIWWNILKNESLNKFHNQLVDRLNSLRENLLLSNFTLTGYSTGEKFTPEEAENVRKYGAVVVKNLFQPHITLAKLKNEVSQEEIEKILPKVEAKFEVNSLHIGKMGDFGTLLEVNETFGLSD